MFKSGVWLLAPLLTLSFSRLIAQEAPATTPEPPAVDTIAPVPAPEIPLGANISGNLRMPKGLNITNSSGQISGSSETGIRFGGPVKIAGDNGMEIFAQTAVLDPRTETLTLEGDVSIYQGNVLQRAESAVYYYETKKLETKNLRASLDPLLLESGKFSSHEEGGRQVFVGEHAGITTHDVEHPNYWIRAQETRVYPGEKIVFKNLLAYAGDIPVFWFPYLSQPLDSELGYHFMPGSKSHWGPYLLNTYGIMLGGKRDADTGERHDAWLLSRWRFDLRAIRGVGVGVRLADTRLERSDAISGLGLYYLQDRDSGYSRSGVVRRLTDAERYNIELKQRVPLHLADNADWRFDANLNYLSDEYYLEDLEEDLYREDPAPDNTIGLYRRSDRSLLSMYARHQMNDFYRSDTRLPEIVLDLARTPLFNLPYADLPLLHEGTVSLGIIGEKSADVTTDSIINPLSLLPPGSPAIAPLLNQLSGYERSLALEMASQPLGDPRREQIRTQLNDTRYTRFHAYEQLSMPMTMGNGLSFTPQAGFGYTRYSAVDGPGKGFDRTQLHLGAEAALKFSKDLGHVRNHSLGIDGLMHVFQPYSSWSLISTDDYQAGDPGVDRLSPTTRPRTLDPIRYSAIDQMESWSILRLGGRNRLITRRDGQSFEWLYLNTYVDAFLNDPEGDRKYSNLYNDVRWHPVPWMHVDLETQFPLANGGSGYNEFASRASFMPSEHFEFSAGYRWLKGHPFLPDSSRVDFRTYSHLTENWGAGTRHTVELDDGTLEHQQYSLHRDMGNWVAGAGLYLRDNRLKDEYGVIFTLTLKDFPSASLPFGYDAE